MDMVQMGEAYVSAHHHIHTNDGWMTAHQASHRGLGRLWTNQDCPRVYSLYLAGGGNIMINTTALLQKIQTQLEAATMGCRFETPNNPHLKGWLTYRDSLLAKLEQYIGMENGRKHFRANEVTTEPNGDLIFRLTPGPKRAEPLTLKIQATYPETGMVTPQDSQLSMQGKMDGKLDANTKGEEREEMCKLIEWIGSLQDLPCSDGELYWRFVNQQQFTAYEGYACPPAKVRSTGYLADSEHGGLRPSDPIIGTTVETSKEDASESNLRCTYPEDRPNLDPRADLRTSKQPLHIFDEIQEAPPAKPEPMDYKKAL